MLLSLYHTKFRSQKWYYKITFHLFGLDSPNTWTRYVSHSFVVMRIWYMNLIMKLMSLVQNSTYLLKTYPVKFVSTITVTGLCWKIFLTIKNVSTKKERTFFVCADNHQLFYCIPWSWDGLWLNTYKNMF